MGRSLDGLLVQAEEVVVLVERLAEVAPLVHVLDPFHLSIS